MSDIPGGGPPSQLTPASYVRSCAARICTTPCHGSHFQLSWPWGVAALLLLFTLGFPIRRTNLGNRSTKRAPFNGVQSPTIADLCQRNQEKWVCLKTGYFQFQRLSYGFCGQNCYIGAYPQIKLCHGATVSSSFFAAAMLLENLQLISLLVVTVGKRLRNYGRTSMYKWNCNPEVGEETSSLPIFFRQSGSPLP